MQDIQVLLKQNLDAIRNFGVKQIGIFGSYIKNQQKDISDIDILVVFEKGRKSFNSFIKLLYFLEDLTQKRIDLVTKESLSPYIGPYILKEVVYIEE